MDYTQSTTTKSLTDSRNRRCGPIGVHKLRSFFLSFVVAIVVCQSHTIVVESFSTQPFMGSTAQRNLNEASRTQNQQIDLHPARDSFRHHRSSSTSMDSATMDQPRAYGEDSSNMTDFQRRMLERMTGKKLSGTKTRRRTGRRIKLPPNVKTVRTLDEYKKVVAGEKDRIVVVRFFATWCKACKAITPAFFRLANKFSDVSFIEVPVTEETADLHQGLGVPSIPFAHIYHPQAGLVEELKMSKKHFPQFEQALTSYVFGSCPFPEGDS